VDPTIDIVDDIFTKFVELYQLKKHEAHLAEQIRRRCGSSSATRYRPLNRAVKCKSNVSS